MSRMSDMDLVYETPVEALDVEALLDRQARERYELQMQHISQRLRLAQRDADAHTVAVCRLALLRLTRDFRDYGATPLFTAPSDIHAGDTGASRTATDAA